MSLKNLTQYPSLKIRQRRELAEFFGFETRNKYEIQTVDGRIIGFAAEQQKGFLGLLLRQVLGHWRRFEIHVFDEQRQLSLVATHPFRFWLQRLEIVAHPSGQFLGALQQRFALFSKRFDVEDEQRNVAMEVRSPIWKIWTFEFKKMDRVVATLKKRWSGVFKEAFLDADNFEVQFNDGNLRDKERLLLLAAALFVDLQYFEKKGD